MRSPDCVIIFHSNRSVEVEPLLLIILKTDFLSRNDQSILNIYSLILSKKKQTLACPNIRSARIETKKNGAVSIVAENPKYPGITKEIPPSARFLFYTVSFVETYFSRKWVGSRATANSRWIPPRSNAKLENSRRVKFENEQNDGPPVSILSRGRNLAGLSARIIPTWDKTEVTSACRKLGVENRPGRSVVPFRWYNARSV